jgi:hypothetical protein
MSLILMFTSTMIDSQGANDIVVCSVGRQLQPLSSPHFTSVPMSIYRLDQRSRFRTTSLFSSILHSSAIIDKYLTQRVV